MFLRRVRPSINLNTAASLPDPLPEIAKLVPASPPGISGIYHLGIFAIGEPSLQNILRRHARNPAAIDRVAYVAARGLTNYWLIGVRGVALYWHVVNVLAVLVVLTQLSPSL